jgi:hypothetical protein
LPEFINGIIPIPGLGPLLAPPTNLPLIQQLGT